MTLIVRYLEDDGLPNNQLDAQRVKARIARWLIKGNLLYKWRYARPLLQCLIPEKGQNMLEDIHKEGCKGHPEGIIIAYKALLIVCFWPTPQNILMPSINTHMTKNLRKTEPDGKPVILCSAGVDQVGAFVEVADKDKHPAERLSSDNNHWAQHHGLSMKKARQSLQPKDGWWRSNHCSVVP